MNLKQKYGKVAVIMGGDSPEHDISLITGNAVLQALLDAGVDAHKFDLSEHEVYQLKLMGFDCAWLAVHGKNCEDGVLQGALEYLQIPYTGSGVLASAIAMDKYRCKLLWNNQNIPTPKFQYLSQKSYDANSFKLEIPLPVIVKPCASGSTIGLSKVVNLNQLHDAIDLAFSVDKNILIEEMILGPEFTLTMDNENIYPLVKIEAKDANYDYQNKYFTTTTNYICPYELPAELMQQIQYHARKSYDIIGATDIVRIDFMLDQHNNVYFLELNTLPGLTDHSLVPLAFRSVGISFKQLCLKWLDNVGLNK